LPPGTPIRECDWLPAVQQRYGGPVEVVGNHRMGGGYVSAEVRRINMIAAGAPTSVVLKRGTSTEIAALRALAQVPGIPGPELIAAGGLDTEAPWLLTPYYPGLPPSAGHAVPEQVYDTLARVHARYLGRPPAGLPRVNATFWRRLCLQVALPSVEAAAVTPHDGFEAARLALPRWAQDARMFAALRLLPATLVHGDMHLGNIVVAGAGGDQATIIDWGNARIAPGGLDLAVLSEQGADGHEYYRSRVAELASSGAGQGLAEVERYWAVAMGYVQYLGFAADCVGGDRVGEMVERAARAFALLGRELDRLGVSA
jgi:aminoglycoside phosphotransferase (APT) family kinase protein